MDKLILKNLLMNPPYAKKVLHYLKLEYFDSHNDKIIFKTIKKYVNEYSTIILPTITVLNNNISKLNNLSEGQKEEINKEVKELELEIQKTKNEEYNLDWLVDETEDFCKSKAMELAIIESVDLIQNKDKNLNKVSEIVKEALKVSFNEDLGICFFDGKDIDKRIEYYQRDVLKISCKITELNTNFSGGFEEKTVSVFMGGQHSGKCLHKSSIVNIRNKKTNKIEKITIEELIKRCQKK